ncbi:GlxA family transcriptional regulator [Bradyrhizobium sp.]|uniref:GlxA family transcriptional regulator n=1 Tax=Bradyrhizobium sp. TaxID=376 RepID=UPI003C51B58E
MAKPARKGGSRSEAADAVVRLNVGFILANRFTLTAFSNFIDALRLAADDGDRSRQILCRWRVMSATGSSVPASCGIALTPDAGLGDPTDFHYVVVVGGLLHQGPQIDPRTQAWLQRAAGAGTPLIGVCTGSFVLKRLGLLDGRAACVSWYHRQDFIDEFGEAPMTDRLFAIDGDRITCAGGTGVLDLAATLVDRHVGSAAARKALNVLQLDRQRTETAPQPTPHLARDTRDQRVRRASLLMEQNLTHPLAIAEIAGRVGVSTRQLDRLFREALKLSPAECYRRMRLDYGRWLLQRTDRSIVDVAAQTGFADGAHFARVFRACFGHAPSSLRNQGRGAQLHDDTSTPRAFN